MTPSHRIFQRAAKDLDRKDQLLFRPVTIEDSRVLNAYNELAILTGYHTRLQLLGIVRVRQTISPLISFLLAQIRITLFNSKINQLDLFQQCCFNMRHQPKILEPPKMCGRTYFHAQPPG
jgi:hypothetical protein